MSELNVMDVRKSFGTNLILDQVSLTVQDGEFVSLLGPSGSGKSTLFSLIGGVLVPDEGEIFLNGKNIIGQRGKISYTPQAPALFPWRTVLQNVLLGQEIAGVKVEKYPALEMLEKAGLKGYENHYPHELSGGMKQRVSFVRSLLSPQSFICLDEPFSALDEFTRLEMQLWLQSLWLENKKSIFFITHNIEEALFLSDRIIVLSKKPATVKKEIYLPFSRPRNKNLLLSEEFLTWKRIIYKELEFSL